MDSVNWAIKYGVTQLGDVYFESVGLAVLDCGIYRLSEAFFCGGKVTDVICELDGGYW